MDSLVPTPSFDNARHLGSEAKIRNLMQSPSANPEKVKKTAQDFEAVFISQMLEHMFADVDADPLFDGPGEEIYRSLMVEEYGKLITKAGGIGVAAQVEREMLKMQEVK